MRYARAMSSSRSPCAARLLLRTSGLLTVACSLASVPSVANAGKRVHADGAALAPEAGDAQISEPSAEDQRIEDALDRAVAAEEAEDWPAAIGAYREAMALGLETVNDSPINEVVAKLHFAYGTSLYNEANYEDALRQFQDAQGLFPAPAFHFNIAKCQEELGKYEAAISSYQAFVRGVPDAPANIDARVRRLEETLALEQAQADQQAAAAAAATKNPGRGLIISGASLAGLGVLTGTVGAVVFGLQAKDKSDQVDAVVSGGNPDALTYGQTLDLDDQGRRAEMLQFVMAAVGGTITVTGAVLLAVGLKKKNERKERTAATLRFAPTLQRDRAGLSLTGRF